MIDLDSPWTRPLLAGERPVIALGTMNFGRRTPAPEASRVVERALERGVRLFDVANIYNEGESEKILGKALGARRGDVLVASKVGLDRVGGKPEGLSRDAIVRACEASLRRLGTDVIDLYYLHAPDHRAPPEEIVGALGELVQQQKIRAWGVSNHASWQALELLHCADARGVPRPRVSQVMYNALIRQVEQEHLRFCARYRLHVTAYNPLAGGLLVGDRRAAIAPGSRFDKNAMYRRRYLNEALLDLVDALAPVAHDEKISLVTLAYAWLAARPGVDSILAGPGSVAHLDDALDGAAHALSPGAMKRVDEVFLDYLGTDASYAR